MKRIDSKKNDYVSAAHVLEFVNIFINNKFHNACSVFQGVPAYTGAQCLGESSIDWAALGADSGCAFIILRIKVSNFIILFFFLS